MIKEMPYPNKKFLLRVGEYQAGSDPLAAVVRSGHGTDADAGEYLNEAGE